jgi:AcrR family transcriptional regulator
MRAVAAAVAVSPMTLYRYFADRAELLATLWESVFEDLVADIKRCLEQGISAESRQRLAIEAFLAYFESKPDRYLLIYGDMQSAIAKDARAGVADTATYGKVLACGRDITTDFCREIGGDLSKVPVASDIGFAMQLGYLYAYMANTRYPWPAAGEFRPIYVSSVMAAIEGHLKNG